jgi:hypothetical protein
VRLSFSLLPPGLATGARGMELIHANRAASDACSPWNRRVEVHGAGAAIMTDANESANQEKSDPYSLVNSVINDTDALYAVLRKLDSYDGICTYAPELLEDMLSGAKGSIDTLERIIALLDKALCFIRKQGKPR